MNPQACSCGGPETCAFPNDCARAHRPAIATTQTVRVRARVRAPLEAIRYAKDGMNVEAVCRFLRLHGSEFVGFTAGNHLYVRVVADAKTEVFPGDWIVARPHRRGVRILSHGDMGRDYERVDGEAL